MIVFKYFVCNCSRSRFEENEVWNNLQTNWNHFFWLTGETPETLQILVNALHRNFFMHRQYGRKSSLDLRHQVLYDVSLCYCQQKTCKTVMFSNV